MTTTHDDPTPETPAYARHPGSEVDDLIDGLLDHNLGLVVVEAVAALVVLEGAVDAAEARGAAAAGGPGAWVRAALAAAPPDLAALVRAAVAAAVDARAAAAAPGAP